MIAAAVFVLTGVAVWAVMWWTTVRPLAQRADTLTVQLQRSELRARQFQKWLDAATARATHAQDERDTALRSRAELIVELRELAEALNQGAHTVAARRIEQFVDDHADQVDHELEDAT